MGLCVQRDPSRLTLAESHNPQESAQEESRGERAEESFTGAGAGLGLGDVWGGRAEGRVKGSGTEFMLKASVGGELP